MSYMGHVLMENRNGLVVDSLLTIGSGTAEREAACAMLDAWEGANASPWAPTKLTMYRSL